METRLPTALSAPSSRAVFFSHLGSKVTSWKLCSPPGLASLTAFSSYPLFTFQDFLCDTSAFQTQQGMNFKISSSPYSPLYFSTSTLIPIYWREGETEGSTIYHHHHTHKLTNPNSPVAAQQTLHSKWACPLWVTLLQRAVCLLLSFLCSSLIFSLCNLASFCPKPALD